MMNIDELMAVWKTQDVAPLHDVDKTLLHLALRQDEAKLQKERRRERWIAYLSSAGVVTVMALFLGMMIYARDRKVMTSWDFVVGVAGAAAALVAAGAMFLSYRAQVRSEQRFGESLRDQLNRRIAQLNFAATKARRTTELFLVTMGGIAPIALVYLGYRVNQKSFMDDGGMVLPLLFTCVWMVWVGVWQTRRSVQQDILPRKGRLEALLKELDAS